MTVHLNRRLAAWLLACAPLSLLAQGSPLDLAFKLRGGVQAQENKDHLGRLVLGFGADLGFTFGKSHRVGLEVGWSYKPGKQYFGGLGDIPTATGRTIDTRPGVSVDNRRNELKGLAARLSYHKAFGEFGIIGGLQAGGGSFRQEYFGDVWSAPATPVFRDVYNGTPEKNTCLLSPFAGVTYRLDKVSSLEVNVVYLRYNAIDYVHQAGYVASTATAPSTDVSRDCLVERHRSVPHLEVAYVFHF